MTDEIRNIEKDLDEQRSSILRNRNAVEHRDPTSEITAFNFLKGAQPQFQSMGGSHAQRDVFERLTIEAGLRAGRLEDTEQLLGTRTALRGNQEDSFAASRMAKIQELRSGPTLFTAAE